MRAIFISDLHLNERDASTQARFDAFMHTDAPTANVIYVLGDLLHVWLGDAMLAGDAYGSRITAQFKALSERGVKIFIARGNRDFMIGDAFADACGATLLDEQTLIDLGGQRTLLMHGDELCTDDVRYQRARRILRKDFFRWIGNALPRAWRHSIAARIRKESRAHKAATAMSIMDANADAIDAAMRAQNANRLIHGHTHRPGHDLRADGNERWVLSDWQQDFGYLVWDGDRFAVQPWPCSENNRSVSGYNPKTLGG